ncbi:MAG: endonuclease domain-containing protein [Ignavibacteriales bacterium]|nr:endonuclease domain-containing protein [Ignavibacteriales bacterium]
MSLNNKAKLVQIAKSVCRELRKNQTEAEKIFWQAVRNRKFCGKKFYRQYPIFHDITGKETFFIADFYCYEAKLVVELDGKIHQYRLIEDSVRKEVINHLGIKVVRFKNDEIVNNLSKLLDEVKKHLDSY